MSVFKIHYLWNGMQPYANIMHAKILLQPVVSHANHHSQGIIKMCRRGYQDSEGPKAQDLAFESLDSRCFRISRRFPARHHEEIHVSVHIPVLNAFPHINEKHFDLILRPTQSEEGLIRPAS